MAKVPIKPIVKGIKEHGPKAWAFIKENGKDIATAKRCCRFRCEISLQYE